MEQQNLLQKIQKDFKNLNCDQGIDHLEEPLNIICVDNRCQEQKKMFQPLCSVCLEQSQHSKRDHKLKNFKRFVKQIAVEIESYENSQKFFNNNIIHQAYGLNKTENNESLEEEAMKVSENQKLMDMEKIKVIEELQSSSKNIKILRDQCEIICNSINKIIDDIQGGESGQVSKIKNQIYQLLEINESSILREKLAQFSSLIHLEEDGTFNLAKQMEDKINFVQFNSKHIKDKVDQIAQDVKNLQIFTSTLNQKKILPELKLKAEYMHSTLEIDNNNNQIVSKTSGICQQTLAVLQRPIKKPVEKFGIIVKEIEGNYNGIGIVSFNKAQEMNYLFNVYNQQNHGAYIINQEGRVYSSHDPGLNQTSLFFQISKDDVVFCEVDSVQRKVKFSKKDSNQRQELNYEYGQDEQIYPCLVLCCEGTKYQLLSEKEVLDLQDQ